MARPVAAMLILAFDTSAGGCSVALLDGDQVLAQDRRAMQRGQSEALLPMIEAICAEGDRPLYEVEGLAVTHGPGSFTGLRIGLAAAEGLALALDIPAVGISSFEARAAGEMRGGPALCVLDSGRAEPFACRLTPEGREDGAAFTDTPAALAALAEREGRLAIGFDIASLAVINDPIDPAGLARLAMPRFADPAALPPLRPHYARAPALG